MIWYIFLKKYQFSVLIKSALKTKQPTFTTNQILHILLSPVDQFSGLPSQIQQLVT